MKYARRLSDKQMGQRDDGIAMQEMPKGKMYQRHAAKIVTSTVRLGRSIMINQIASVPGTPKETELLDKMRQLVRRETETTNRPSSRKLEALTAKQMVLRASQQIRDFEDGRDPTILQILGMGLLTYGPNSYELKRMAVQASTLYNYHKDMVTFRGQPSDVSRSINLMPVAHQNYVSEIDLVLYKAGKPLTSAQIAERLGVAFDADPIDLINSSLQLLEVAGLVKKLPKYIDLDRHCTVWVCREYKPRLDIYKFESENSTHYRNISLEILNQLMAGSKMEGELYKRQDKKSEKGKYRYSIGSSDAIYGTKAIGRTTKLLESAGLVASEIIQTKGSPSKSFKITELGQQLWMTAIETGILPEALIKLILGEKEDKTKLEDLLRA